MTAPDAPREAEVRAWLKSHALFDTPEAVAALALLDAGRKDREALVIADEWFGGCDCITTETGTDERKRRYWELRRAAIDRARVEAIRLPDYSHRVENLAQESR